MGNAAHAIIGLFTLSVDEQRSTEVCVRLRNWTVDDFLFKANTLHIQHRPDPRWLFSHLLRRSEGGHMKMGFSSRWSDLANGEQCSSFTHSVVGRVRVRAANGTERFRDSWLCIGLVGGSEILACAEQHDWGGLAPLQPPLSIIHSSPAFCTNVSCSSEYFANQSHMLHENLSYFHKNMGLMR